MDLYDLYLEMRDKYGFNEGDTPDGIEAVREKIIELINEGLPKNSKIEAYPVDRMGVHNWCIIGFRNKESLREGGAPDAEVRQILSKANHKWIVRSKISLELIFKDWD